MTSYIHQDLLYWDSALGREIERVRAQRLAHGMLVLQNADTRGIKQTKVNW